MDMSNPASQSVWIETLRQRIEDTLAAAFAAWPQTAVLRAARYVTQGGGHRWRGLMAIAAGHLFRPEAESVVLPLAAALEMMHAASLVLDDLPSMDDALTRRGKPCVHLVFPREVVDMLPAFLLNLAYHVTTDNSQAPEGCRIRALLLLGEMGGRLAHGQELDLTLARSPVSESALMECYALKSGSLFAASLAGGALLCGAGAADAAALREAGLKLGQAYQIMDDIADGPEEDSEYKEAGRFTAFSLYGPGKARVRAEKLLAEVMQLLDRFGPAASRLRGLLDQILPRATP
jgi:geranylgeranyl pyrophosphate synthase